MIRMGQRRLLYVDDTVEQRYAMRRILERQGYEVLEAGTGAEAMNAMARGPELVILDVRLPDMNGYDVCRQIKAMDGDLPVIQVSASFSDPHLRVSGLCGGADAYIAQPVYPAELVALVQTLLNAGDARRSLRNLAKISSQISSSLSLPETAENICKAMAPFFADSCYLLLPQVPGFAETLWPCESEPEPSLREAMKETARTGGNELVDEHAIVASLPLGSGNFGAIAFLLDDGREYSDSDLEQASDLAHRAGLALENCMLYTSERATRSALIESEKLATAGRMSAAIAHEINNPLESVTNLIYLIQTSPDATPQIRERAASALSELSRLAHITRQNLGFYRELSTPTEVDLRQIAEETLSLYAGRFHANRITLQKSLKPACVNAIKGEIRQVLSNLLVNAIEAVGERGTISIATARDDDRAVLEVSDSGGGIPSAILPKIFEPFFTTKEGFGTGLGLWISKGIVEKHGGTISVSDRADGNGARFRVVFGATPCTPRSGSGSRP